MCLETELNEVTHSKEIAATFDAFAQQWMRSYQVSGAGSRKTILPFGKAPLSCLHLRKREISKGRHPWFKVQVRVVRVTSLYDGHKHREDLQEIRMIDLRP